MMFFGATAHRSSTSHVICESQMFSGPQNFRWRHHTTNVPEVADHWNSNRNKNCAPDIAHGTLWLLAGLVLLLYYEAHLHGRPLISVTWRVCCLCSKRFWDSFTSSTASTIFFFWSMTLKSIKLVLSCLVSHLLNKFKVSEFDLHDWRTVAWVWTDLNHLKQHFWHDCQQPPFSPIDWNVL